MGRTIIFVPQTGANLSGKQMAEEEIDSKNNYRIITENSWGGGIGPFGTWGKSDHRPKKKTCHGGVKFNKGGMCFLAFQSADIPLVTYSAANCSF